MNFLNIGFPELFFVLIIMLVFLGPQRMASSMRSLARFISKVVRSETWRNFFGLYKEIKQYPSQIMKEVKLEELSKELGDLQTKTRAEINGINQEIRTQESETDQAVTESKREVTRKISSESGNPNNDLEDGS
jgi:Sec-independent protein translocase protein TatA